MSQLVVLLWFMPRERFIRHVRDSRKWSCSAWDNWQPLTETADGIEALDRMAHRQALTKHLPAEAHQRQGNDLTLNGRTHETVSGLVPCRAARKRSRQHSQGTLGHSRRPSVSCRFGNQLDQVLTSRQGWLVHQRKAKVRLQFTFVFGFIGPMAGRKRRA